MVLPLLPSGGGATASTPGCDNPAFAPKLAPGPPSANCAQDHRLGLTGAHDPTANIRTCAMLTPLISRRSLQAALAAGLLIATGSGPLAQTRDKVVVASKIDTEGALLGHIIALVLERQGIPVESR